MVTQVDRGPWALNAVRDSEELKGGPETRETEDRAQSERSVPGRLRDPIPPPPCRDAQALPGAVKRGRTTPAAKLCAEREGRAMQRPRRQGGQGLGKRPAVQDHCIPEGTKEEPGAPSQRKL